jgi:hypothetical protein
MGTRIAALGFSSARTTMGGLTNARFDPMRMPTTMQIYPHRRHTQVRHALKEFDGRGLKGILGVRPWSTRPQELLLSFSEAAGRSELGALHVWGHSWEIEAEGLWPALAETLAILAAHQAKSVTNSELAHAARSATARSTDQCR